MKIKVSIIIPTFKRSLNLDRAINSALNQTYKEVEVLVIDDNNSSSKDRVNTEKTVEKFLGSNKFRYIKHKKNKGGSAARNTGIKHSKGEYVAFLDDDDEYALDRIEKLVNEIEKNDENTLGVISDYQLVNKYSRKNGVKKEKGSFLRELLMRKYDIGTGSNLFLKKKIFENLKGFKEDFKRHQDLEILGRVFTLGEVAYVDEPLVFKYRGEYLNTPSIETYIEVKVKYLNLFEEEIKKFDKKTQEFIFKVQWKSVFEMCLANGELRRGIKILKANKIKLKPQDYFKSKKILTIYILQKLRLYKLIKSIVR